MDQLKIEIMFQIKISQQKYAVLSLVMLLAGLVGHSQINPRQPTWWFGESGAANFNYFRGTTQMLNGNLTVPTAFHKGDGVKPYVSLLSEYRPNKKWGGMLNLAYDNRGGKFDKVMAPCNCEATLSTNISYVTLEPSVRLAPFSSAFYIFAGPTLSFNAAKKFDYTQQKQNDVTSTWSDIAHTSISAQAGAGIDIPLSSKNSPSQMALSPFLSFQTDLGHAPRKVESWSFYTIRAGVALKFGNHKQVVTKNEVVMAPALIEKEVEFSVRAPKVIPVQRLVKETFPIRNSVFFDMGSSHIPERYIQLNAMQASTFKEEQLQQGQPANLSSGRSSRQLSVYYQILNIIGDRMRSNPQSSILLSGASEKNPKDGKVMAEEIKNYLVTVFGVDADKIATEGRDRPLIPSEQPGGTKELSLLREGDRRVDIESISPELLMQVGGKTSPFLKPVQIIALQEDPLDSHVLFNVKGASDVLESWNVEVTDQQGNVQHYGPFYNDQASVSGSTILKGNAEGNFTITMLGQTKSGQMVKKESSVSLMKTADLNQQGLRYSILFDFDKSKSIAAYENFLTEIVTPLISENATVIIHGHTDIIGDANYNHTLSHDRVMGVQRILESALSKSDKKGIKFESYGFGEDEGIAPFNNNLPEERFYNRTVIIDIIASK